MSGSRIYVVCPECAADVVLLEVDAELHDGDELGPDDNRELQRVVYGRVPRADELEPEVVVRCPRGHGLVGAVVHARPRP